MDHSLLGGASAEQFLKKHWQKKPLLVRQAFPGFVDPVSADELAGMALEDEVESRLVFEKGRKRPWQAERGPFAEKTLRALPKSHWTLLVQGVDKYVEAAGAILDQFDFLPGWRLDDLMVSFAPEHGSVGPHIDSYDVFLIQGQGRRRWQIQTKPDTTTIPGLDMKILKRFEAESEWVLESGDMLYLPPGVAHYGVALESCLTYSVGFRAPAHAALIRELFNLPEELTAPYETEALFEDPWLKPVQNPGEISPEAVKAFQAILERPLKDTALLTRWLGRFLTDVRTPPPRSPKPGPAKVQAALAAGRALVRSDRCRFAFNTVGGKPYLYLDGEEIEVSPAAVPLAKALCAGRRVETAALPASCRKSQDTQALIARLVGHGAARFARSGS